MGLFSFPSFSTRYNTTKKKTIQLSTSILFSWMISDSLASRIGDRIKRCLGESTPCRRRLFSKQRWLSRAITGFKGGRSQYDMPASHPTHSDSGVMFPNRILHPISIPRELKKATVSCEGTHNFFHQKPLGWSGQLFVFSHWESFKTKLIQCEIASGLLVERQFMQVTGLDTGVGWLTCKKILPSKAGRWLVYFPLQLIHDSHDFRFRCSRGDEMCIGGSHCGSLYIISLELSWILTKRLRKRKDEILDESGIVCVTSNCTGSLVLKIDWCVTKGLYFSYAWMILKAQTWSV